MNWTLDVGTIVQIVTILIGGIIALVRVESKLNILTHERIIERESTLRKFGEIDEHLKKLGEVLIQLARQEVRMDAVDKRIAELVSRIEDMNEGGTRFSPQRSKKRTNE